MCGPVGFYFSTPVEGKDESIDTRSTPQVDKSLDPKVRTRPESAQCIIFYSPSPLGDGDWSLGTTLGSTGTDKKRCYWQWERPRTFSLILRRL